MYRSTTAGIYSRDDSDGSGLSLQNIIIISVCSGIAGLLLCYLFYRSIRNCRRFANAAPLPPVQPLAHHREYAVARVESSISRPQTWYQPDIPATHSIGSKASLLGKESPLISPSNPSASLSVTDTGHELELSLHSPDRHLPLPSPSYRNGRPGSSSSFNSSDASHGSSLSPESSAPPMPRSITDLRSPPFRRPRPSSMSSMGSYNTTTSRTSRHTLRGVPHSPHSQVQIVLPTPLASVNNSRESLPLSRSRRQSLADPWLVIETTTTTANPSIESIQPDETHSQTRRRRRPASMSSLRSQSMIGEEPDVPPVPQLPTNWDIMSQKNNRSASDSRWVPSHQTVHEEDGDSIQHKKLHKLEKRRPGV